MVGSGIGGRTRLGRRICRVIRNCLKHGPCEDDCRGRVDGTADAIKVEADEVADQHQRRPDSNRAAVEPRTDQQGFDQLQADQQAKERGVRVVVWFGCGREERGQTAQRMPRNGMTPNHPTSNARTNGAGRSSR